MNLCLRVIRFFHSFLSPSTLLRKRLNSEIQSRQDDRSTFILYMSQIYLCQHSVLHVFKRDLKSMMFANDGLASIKLSNTERIRYYRELLRVNDEIC